MAGELTAPEPTSSAAAESRREFDRALRGWDWPEDALADARADCMDAVRQAKLSLSEAEFVAFRAYCEPECDPGDLDFWLADEEKWRGNYDEED